MSYRKKVKLFKGVHLNLSGSGVGIGFSLLPGVSFSLNKNGVYNNTSLPGTGLYKRTKLASFSDNSATSTNKVYESDDHAYQISLGLDNNGKLKMTISENGMIISEEEELKRVKRRPDVKAAIVSLQSNLKDKIDNDDSAFIEIYKHTEHPVLPSTVLKKLNTLSFVPEVPQNFNEAKPTMDDVKRDLEREAEKKVSTILFWRNKAKREQYVENNLQSSYDNKYSEWRSRKESYEIEERKRVENINSDKKATYDSLLKSYETYLKGHDTEVAEQIDKALSGLSLPCEFSLDYVLDLDSERANLNLDLPEIEDIPKIKASFLASGKISVKDKTKKEIAEDYATCVTGLAFFFAGMFFNISSKINTIEVSGYTQRIDGKTGGITDQYIYKVEFDRETFRNLKFGSIIPYDSFELFPHQMELTKQLTFKTI